MADTEQETKDGISVEAEIAALTAIVGAMESLDEEARSRTVCYLVDRFKIGRTRWTES